jgi:hypothetical protein
LPKERTRGGLVTNLVLVAVLALLVTSVANLTLGDGQAGEGRLSPKSLLALARAPQGGLITQDVTNGIYETQSGRPVLYVRGEIENRTSAATPVRVKAELWDGTQLLKTVEGVAGAAASPEELYGLATAQDVAKLNGRLKAQGQTVATGGHAPFLLAFDAFPPELSSLRLKVSAASAR